MGQVRMKHPDREDVVEVAERAFDVIWSKKGWELVNPYLEDLETGEDEDLGDSFSTDSYTDPTDTRIPTLETMEEEELREVAEELGIEGHDVLTANELRSLIGNTPEFYDMPDLDDSDE